MNAFTKFAGLAMMASPAEIANPAKLASSTRIARFAKFAMLATLTIMMWLRCAVFAILENSFKDCENCKDRKLCKV